MSGKTLAILLVFLVIVCGCSREMFELKREAEVLSAVSKNTIDVKFIIGTQMFFEDLEVSNSIIAYYKEREKLPLTLEIEESDLRAQHRINIRLEGYYIKTTTISKSLYEQIRRETIDFHLAEKEEIYEGENFNY